MVGIASMPPDSDLELVLSNSVGASPNNQRICPPVRYHPHNRANALVLLSENVVTLVAEWRMRQRWSCCLIGPDLAGCHLVIFDDFS